MKFKRSLSRRSFDYSIVIGGLALVGFIAHSAFIGATAFPFGLPQEAKETVGSAAAGFNYALGFLAALAFITMLGCGFYCTYTGEMELESD